MMINKQTHTRPHTHTHTHVTSESQRDPAHHPPLRSRFLAPLVVCVVILVSILTVCRLLVSREMMTLCQWLSFRGLLELPLIRWAPFPRSDT